MRPGPSGQGLGQLAAISKLYQGPKQYEERPLTRGPLWFQKMDRNRDGDVSRKEFLGTDEQFKQIDTDGDGLISLEEAQRYDSRKPSTDEPRRRRGER